MSVPNTQHRVVVAAFPDGIPQPTDFRVEEALVPDAEAGEVLVRVIDLSLDPYLRSVLSGRHIGHTRPEIGALMPGRATAEVVRSDDATLPVGSHVVAETGWQQYAAVPRASLRRVDRSDAPLSTALGILGMPGLTAWAGITQRMSLHRGKTFVVSAAIGGVGSTAGQLARVHGCRVIGIAGGAQKCALAVSHFGFDACIDYRDNDWETRLHDATPSGIDAYFDNTGGRILEGVLRQLVVGGEIVLCGLIDQYNTGVPYALPLAPVIGKRATLRGLVVYDFESQYPEYLAFAAPLVRNEQLRYLEDRSNGLTSAPLAFHRLMSGQNIGKAIVAVGEP
jgi:NADPH-dependent curcumin reductase